MSSLLLTQIIQLEQNKLNYLLDFRRSITAKYITVNCNRTPLILAIDALKNNFTIDDTNTVSVSNQCLTNTNIKWPVRNSKFESINIQIMEPHPDMTESSVSEIFIIIQFYN
jgi:hypothetical protein